MFGRLGNFNLEKIISNLLCLFPTTSKLLSTRIHIVEKLLNITKHALCPREFTNSAAPNPKGAGCSVQRDVTHTGLISSY